MDKGKLRSKATSGQDDKAGDATSKQVAKPDSNKRLKKKIIKYEKMEKEEGSKLNKDGPGVSH